MTKTYKVKFTFDKDGKQHDGTCEIESPSKEAAEDSAYAVLNMRKFEGVKVGKITQVEAAGYPAVGLNVQNTNPSGKYYVEPNSTVFLDRKEWEDHATKSGLDVEDGPAIGRQLCAFRGNTIVGVFTYKSNKNETQTYGYIRTKDLK